jgi:hypothetical protein
MTKKIHRKKIVNSKARPCRHVTAKLQPKRKLRTAVQLRTVRAAYAGVRRHRFLWKWEAHWKLLEPIHVRGCRPACKGKADAVPPVCRVADIVSTSVLRALGVVPLPEVTTNRLMNSSSLMTPARARDAAWGLIIRTIDEYRAFEEDGIIVKGRVIDPSGGRRSFYEREECESLVEFFCPDGPMDDLIKKLGMDNKGASIRKHLGLNHRGMNWVPVLQSLKAKGFK